jgi:hypothetical protein
LEVSRPHFGCNSSSEELLDREVAACLCIAYERLSSAETITIIVQKFNLDTAASEHTLDLSKRAP